MKLIDQNIDKINSLCNSHYVSQLYVFGSILTEQFTDTSDVDFLIQFTAIDVNQYFDNYYDFKINLEQMLNREIDLVENQAIKNPIFRRIVDREKKLIYERKNS